LTVDFAKKGTYEWYCPIDGHRGRGMEGKIAVAGGGGGGGGGSSTSSSNNNKSSY
ncbi:MAG: Copper binding protein plastocyanin/azurin family, partial [Solirubrobacteraceae bacterium]|nr:Copper binding protein plastocyanin/azurin family [Solirubrobacteraceae bacterium]